VRRESITAIVLCGGSGERLGAADKTLAPLADRPLIQYALEALRPQVGALVLGCGRDPGAYASFGYPLASDETPGSGPLGGIVGALSLVRTEWILIYPGDAPFPDATLVERLAATAEREGLAVPVAGGYRQHLVLLLRRARAAALAGFYAEGGRAIREWLDAAGASVVDMDDLADAFFNVNTPEDLARAERRLATRG